MQHLKAVSVENGAIVATGDDGTQYRIQLDEEMRKRLREPGTATGALRRSSPREIQTYIRGGMSAEQVSKYAGVPIEHVQRYERPILAEREYMVEAAKTVPVTVIRQPGDLENLSPTFGSVMEERLEQLGAEDIRWSSWKEPTGGWILKLAFAADEIAHDARWSFDAKKLGLVPLNGEAVALSQQGDVSQALQPRLHAVPEVPSAEARFDSAIFALPVEDVTPPEPQPDPALTTGRIRLPNGRPSDLGVHSEEVAPPEHGSTADLLEALRRRRGERQAPAEDAAAEPRPVTGSVRTLERVRTERPASATETTQAPVVPAPAPSTTATGPVPGGRRRGRTAMPSWEEIVFGARPEDDPA